MVGLATHYRPQKCDVMLRRVYLYCPIDIFWVLQLILYISESTLILNFFHDVTSDVTSVEL